MAKPDPNRDSTGAAAEDGLRFAPPSRRYRAGPDPDTFYTDSQEVGLMIVLLSLRDPDDFASAEAKSLIYKCKAATNQSIGDGGQKIRETNFRRISID